MQSRRKKKTVRITTFDALIRFYFLYITKLESFMMENFQKLPSELLCPKV